MRLRVNPSGVSNPLNQTAFAGFRAYVEPETKVGPSYSEVIYDRAIKFGTNK